MPSGYNKGDVVQLKSGGPRMTVSEVNEGSGGLTYECTWFDKDSLRREEFDEELIENYVFRLGMRVV